MGHDSGWGLEWSAVGLGRLFGQDQYSLWYGSLCEGFLLRFECGMDWSTLVDIFSFLVTSSESLGRLLCGQGAFSLWDAPLCEGSLLFLRTSLFSRSFFKVYVWRSSYGKLIGSIQAWNPFFFNFWRRSPVYDAVSSCFFPLRTSLLLHIAFSLLSCLIAPYSYLIWPA